MTGRHRHVWVVPAGGEPIAPGLLLEWRRDGAGWSAQVAMVNGDALLVQWLPADRLRPVLDGSWIPERSQH